MTATIDTAAPLANMSARPRTNVTRTVPVLRGRWVHFTPTRTRPYRQDLNLAELDDWWGHLGFHGAVVLHRPLDPLRTAAQLRPCRDRRLTLNVLLRQRDGLLHSRFPLLDDPAVLDDAGWCTDDPRLVTAASGRRLR
jgi:hypothetical protein